MGGPPSPGAMTIADLTAGDYIDLRSNSPILIQNASSGETINLQTLGTLTTGNLTAGNSVLGQAVGAISVGTVSAGLVDPSTVEGAQYRASFASDGNITTGAITADGNIGFGLDGGIDLPPSMIGDTVRPPCVVTSKPDGVRTSPVIRRASATIRRSCQCS